MAILTDQTAIILLITSLVLVFVVGVLLYFIFKNRQTQRASYPVTKINSSNTMEDIHARMEELSILRQVTEALNQASTMRGALLPVLKTILNVTKSKKIWLLLLANQDQPPQRIEFEPLTKEGSLVFSEFSPDNYECTRSLINDPSRKSAEFTGCVCLSTQPNTREKFRHFSMPLSLGKQPLGVLNLLVDSSTLIDENKIQLLKTICESLSVALERVRLFKLEHDQRKLAETMQDITTTLTASLDLGEVFDLLLVQLSRLIPYDGGNMMVIDGPNARIARVRGYKGAEKEVLEIVDTSNFEVAKTHNLNKLIESRQPLIIADTSLDPGWVSTKVSKFFRSWMGVPIVIEGNVEAIFSLDKIEKGFFTPEHSTIVTIFANQASLAIKNARLFHQESHRIEELDGLQETLSGISSELDLNVLLKTIVSRAISLLHASLGELGLYEWESQKLRILVSENLDKNYIGGLIDLGSGLMGKVAETRQPLSIHNYKEWPGRLPQYEKLGPHSGLAVPMLAGSELVGVIGVGDNNLDRRFNQDEIRLLNSFAQQAVIAIRNARLFEDAKRRAEEAETLRKAGAVVATTLNQNQAINRILEQLIQVVPYDSASVLLVKNEKLRVVGGHGFQDINTILGLEIPLTNEHPGSIVYMKRKPLIVNDILQKYPEFNQIQPPEKPILSWLGVPLSIQDRTIGILSLDSHKLSNFTNDHARLVKAFADQVSIALENVRLYSEAIHSANRFETLYRLSQVISSNLRPEEIYPAIHQAVSALMQTEFFSISLVDQEHHVIQDVYMKDREISQELGSRPLGAGLFAKVIGEGKSRLYNTFGREELAETGAVLIGELDEPEISQSLLIVPLKVGTRVIGVISAQSYQQNAYTENDQETLELLGANMAIAIENAKLFSEVQNLAITDPLTKLFNRRQFYQLSVREFEESKRYKRPLSIIMLDIDHFKRVNDTYGHSVGDQFLQQLAETCKNNLRLVDILARYGGEEFVVLMPETTPEEAFAIADRLRLDVSKTPIITQYGEMPVTISLGVVTQDKDCKNLEELLDRSDQAMYASKRAGRNRVSLWEPGFIPSPPSTEKILR